MSYDLYLHDTPKPKAQNKDNQIKILDTLTKKALCRFVTGSMAIRSLGYLIHHDT